MEFDHVLALRKSVRSYTDETVSKEDLDALVKAAHPSLLSGSTMTRAIPSAS